MPPGHRALVSTGVAFNFPKGWYGRLHGRSGLRVKQGVEAGIGIIDEGYTGEVKVCLFNFDPYEPLTVKVGDKVAQVIFQPYYQANFEEVQSLPDKARGAAGFGSTGK